MKGQEQIIGHAPTLLKVLERAAQVAVVDRPVLIMGERGTGKELMAAYLHHRSARREGPLLDVNCASFPDELLESELFGHQRGAFTGATHLHHGRIERAAGGTLFLDEMGNMSLRAQEKLLRVVEYGRYERLGDQVTRQADVRLVVATNADLPALVEQGRFRADLLDRLSFDVLRLPPLRDRLDDVPELARHFATRMCQELGWARFRGFSEDAVRALLRHNWPGNVRELKNAVERSLVHWNDPDTLVGKIELDPFRSPGASGGEIGDGVNLEGAASPGRGLASAMPTGTAPAGVAPVAASSGSLDFDAAVAGYQKALLRQALAANGGHQRRAAATLKLGYGRFRRLLYKHKLLPGRRGDAARE